MSSAKEIVWKALPPEKTRTIAQTVSKEIKHIASPVISVVTSAKEFGDSWKAELHQLGKVELVTSRFGLEDHFPTLDAISAFNDRIYSSLRHFPTEQLKAKLEDARLHYSQRKQQNTIQQLLKSDLLIIDDDFFSSYSLLHYISKTSAPLPTYIIFRGIKTFQAFQIFQKLLEDPSARLILEDHSTAEGIAFFELEPKANKECPQAELERFDYQKDDEKRLPLEISREPSKQRELLTFFLSPNPREVIHLLPYLINCDLHCPQYDFFIICEKSTALLLNRFFGAERVLSYCLEYFQDNRQAAKDWVQSLFFLKPSQLLLLTDETFPLAGLVSYEAAKNDNKTTLRMWSEILGDEKQITTDNLQDFISKIELPFQQSQKELPLSSAEISWARQLSDRAESDKLVYILTNPRYPSSRLESLVDYLIEQRCKVVISDSSDKILNSKNDDSLTITYPISIGQHLALIKESALVIGPESLPIRLASYLQTPHILLAGGGSLSRSLLLSEYTTVACDPFTCSECDWSCKNSDCLKGITPRLIIEAAKIALTRDINIQQRAELLFHTENLKHSAEATHLSLLAEIDAELRPILMKIDE